VPAQVVGRADQAVLPAQVPEDLAAVVGVVAQCDDVHPGSEHLVGDVGRDPQPTGAVLPVDDDERGFELLAQARQHRQQRAPPEPADHVADEEDRRHRRCRASPTTSADGPRMPAPVVVSRWVQLVTLPVAPLALLALARAARRAG
jgi:CheY-like chemotaxis protein